MEITPFTSREVKLVEVYRYLGVHLDNRLGCKYNTEAVYRKGNFG